MMKALIKKKNIKDNKELTKTKKIDGVSKLVDNTSRFENYDVSFQLYQEDKQKKRIKELTKEDLKELDKLILKIIKCKKEDELKAINRGKTNKGSCYLEFPNIDNSEIIHLGHDKSKFRLHGVFLGKSFKIICIDPNHEVHPHK